MLPPPHQVAEIREPYCLSLDAMAGKSGIRQVEYVPFRSRTSHSHWKWP
jgi:hypothetical protein